MGVPASGANANANDGTEVAVIGGGVVGCAVAAALARAGHAVLLLEKAGQLGAGITSRNSGVIHSGLYYPPGSLKALSCVRGNRLLYQWAARHQVWHRKTGKLVVAQHPGQLADLEQLHANARAAGAPGVQLISGARARKHEPAITALAALWCPETGIIDPHELVLSLRAAAEADGAVFAAGAEVTAIEVVGAGFSLATSRGAIHAQQVVNAAGLDSDLIARLVGFDQHQLHPCRGDYFRLRTSVRYRHLVYPLKDRQHPGLGIHLTLERGGGYRLGPDVSYVQRRDDFADLAAGARRRQTRRVFRRRPAPAGPAAAGPAQLRRLRHPTQAARPRRPGREGLRVCRIPRRVRPSHRHRIARPDRRPGSGRTRGSYVGGECSYLGARFTHWS